MTNLLIAAISLSILVISMLGTVSLLFLGLLTEKWEKSPRYPSKSLIAAILLVFLLNGCTITVGSPFQIPTYQHKRIDQIAKSMRGHVIHVESLRDGSRRFYIDDNDRIYWYWITGEGVVLNYGVCRENDERFIKTAM